MVECVQGVPITYNPPTYNVLPLTAIASQIVPAQLDDCNAVITLFGALHRFNTALDPYFALSDGWESLLKQQFCATHDNPDALWLLVKNGKKDIGLLMAAVHVDSPLFRHRTWVEVEAVYVVDAYRSMGIARHLLNRAYAWAEALNVPRIQLYVTATNTHAQAVYAGDGFVTSQAIMRKNL